MWITRINFKVKYSIHSTLFYNKSHLLEVILKLTLICFINFSNENMLYMRDLSVRL